MKRPSGIRKVLKKPANWRWCCVAEREEDFQARMLILSLGGSGRWLAFDVYLALRSWVVAVIKLWGLFPLQVDRRLVFEARNDVEIDLVNAASKAIASAFSFVFLGMSHYGGVIIRIRALPMVIPRPVA